MDEAWAVERMRQGGLDGLEWLYARHHRAIYLFSGRQLGDWHLAEDAAQDTFLRAFRYSSSFRRGASVRPWLFGIAYRVCRDAYRQRRQAGGPEDLPEPHQEVPRPGELSELERALERALASLPEVQRAAFLLHRVEERSLREVAAILECPVGTVKSRVHHATRRLWTALGDFVEGEAPWQS